ncbi:SCO7613 C-terminal domain-containing membrane protein, partial [Cellulomonas cellasea]
LATARRASDPRERADLAAVGLFAAGLGALAGAASLTQPPGDALVAAFGLLVLAVAVLRAAAGTAPWWGVAGAVLVLPPALQDEVWRGVVTVVLGAALVGAAVAVRRSGTAPGAVDGGPRADADPAVAPRGSGAFRVARSTHTLLLGTAALLALLGPARLATTRAGGPGASLGAVEVWALPAAVLLAVALRELTRRTTPVAAAARSTGIWLVAAVAAVPTAVAATALAPSPLSLGRTLAVLATGATVAVAGVTGTAPPRRVLGTSLVPLGLAVAGLAWFASAAAPSVPPPATVLAAVGLLVAGVGAAHVARADPGAGWPFLGALLVVQLVGTPAPWGGPPVGLVVASVALGVGAGLSRAGVAARAGAVPLSVAALLAVAVAARHTADAASAAAGLRVELVALGSALVLGAALTLLARRWPFPGPSPRTWGPWPVALAATLPSLSAALDDPADLVRPGVVLGACSVLAILGAARVARRAATTSAPTPTPASGRAPAARLWGAAATQVRAVGVVLAAAAALLTAARGGAVPVDAPLVLLGATLLVVGTLALRSDSRASSWTCLAPGLVLAVVVPVATAWWEPTMWRLVLVLVGATAAVVVGAVLRWQAPFVLGTGSLAVVAVVQVSPAAVAAMQVVEWWVVLALGGAVLLGLGLTYERRLREAREAARFVVAMR